MQRMHYMGPPVEAAGSLYWPPCDCDTVLRFEVVPNTEPPGSGCAPRPRSARLGWTGMLGHNTLNYVAPFTLGPDGNLYAAPYNAAKVLVVYPQPGHGLLGFLDVPDRCLCVGSDTTRTKVPRLRRGDLSLYAAALTLASNGVMYAAPHYATGVLAVDARGREPTATLLPSSLLYTLLGAHDWGEGCSRDAAIAMSASRDATDRQNFGLWAGPLVEAGDGKLYCWPVARETGGVLCVDPRGGGTRLLGMPAALLRGLRGVGSAVYSGVLVRGPDGALYLGPKSTHTGARVVRIGAGAIDWGGAPI
jgi:hypothetical protein